MAENEKQFESNIEAFLISPKGGYVKATDKGYAKSCGMALDIDTLVSFIRNITFATNAGILTDIACGSIT